MQTLLADFEEFFVKLKSSQNIYLDFNIMTY